MENNKMTFEDNMLRLEKIIDTLEGGESPLDECLALFEEGVKLSKSCMSILDNAEQKVKLLTETSNSTYSETNFIADEE